MAGHSKWKNIQHRKGAQDARKGKIFTKIAVEITVAARQSGGDPDDNPRLRTALAKARAANMPKENYIRAIKKGTGELAGSDYIEKTYEGYGPCGIAVFVECLTDNVNRTVSEIRFAFTKSGGNLGIDGSVARMFDKKGIIIYDREQIKSFDALFECALEHGAEDVKEEDNQIEILCGIESFFGLKSALDAHPANFGEPLVCELTRIPNSYNEIDPDKIDSLNRLISTLEDNDDVQNVYHNANLPDSE